MHNNPTQCSKSDFYQANWKHIPVSQHHFPPFGTPSSAPKIEKRLNTSINWFQSFRYPERLIIGTPLNTTRAPAVDEKFNQPPLTYLLELEWRCKGCSTSVIIITNIKGRGWGQEPDRRRLPDYGDINHCLTFPAHHHNHRHHHHHRDRNLSFTTRTQLCVFFFFYAARCSVRLKASPNNRNQAIASHRVTGAADLWLVIVNYS